MFDEMPVWLSCELKRQNKHLINYVAIIYYQLWIFFFFLLHFNDWIGKCYWSHARRTRVSAILLLRKEHPKAILLCYLYYTILTKTMYRDQRGKREKKETLSRQSEILILCLNCWSFSLYSQGLDPLNQ